MSHPILYRSLSTDPNVKAFRLLMLLPGQINATIQCNLFVSSLVTKRTPYEALSYEWGNPHDPKSIIEVNGQRLFVRRNLWLALSALRSIDTEQIMWVDAICINQEDTEERNSQVTLMGQIFSSATLVRVWLGKDVISEEATRFIVDKARGNFPTQEHHRDDPVEKRRVICAMLQGLVALTNTSYWSRIWIVQEVVLARDIILHFGYAWLKRDEFESLTYLDVVGYLTYHEGVPVDIDISEIYDGRASKILKQRSGRGRDSSLAGLLKATEEAKCSVPHDRVYALLGLASDMTSGSIPIDYNRRLVDVKSDIIQWYLQVETTRAVDSGYDIAEITSLVNAAFGDFSPQLVSRITDLHTTF